MTKHTRGPWEINSVTTVYAQNGMIQVALCKTNISSPEGDTLEKARANAHLIAAAPELLEALEELLKSEESPHSETVRYLAREEARAAIDKVKGRVR